MTASPRERIRFGVGVLVQAVEPEPDLSRTFEVEEVVVVAEVAGVARDVEIAEQASVGLLVVAGGAVSWLNPSARALLASRGVCVDDQRYSAGDHGELVEMLGGVQIDAGAQEVCWTAVDGSPRCWWTTGRHLDRERRSVLYEIVDLTVPANPTGPTGTDVPQVDRTVNGEWRLERLEELAGLGSWEWSLVDNRVTWSVALLRLFGYAEDTDLDFPTYRSWLHPEDVSMIETTLAESLRTGESFTYTHRMFLADRVTERIFQCFGEVICDSAGEPVRVLGTAQDVTEQHKARAELAFLAGHDALTGLANRRQITDRLAECAADPAGGALLLIDVDNFKDVNDLRGHAVGDQVMRALARLLSTLTGPDMLLGRLGGDEFAVIAPGCAVAVVAELAERMCDVVARSPVVAGGSALRLTVSIGVAVVEPGSEYEVGLAHADLALYEAKNAGRNRVRLFAADQYRQAARRVSVLQRVGDALDGGGLQLDAQPIIELATGAVARYELLVRLRDGRGPDLDPAQFLPAAERTDLILRLDRWVIGAAVRALAEPGARAAGVCFEVNVSARSLDDPELGEWILAQLERADVAPERLGLEITETAAITSLDAARGLAMMVVKAGCGFALDDFGAGFGSFSYLKHLPFTTVKIAGEFVRDVDTNPVDRALVDAVVRVAHQLGMRTVAEHVDRPAVGGVLGEIGVDYAQGFHFGRPRPLDELLSALLTYQALHH